MGEKEGKPRVPGLEATNSGLQNRDRAIGPRPGYAIDTIAVGHSVKRAALSAVTLRRDHLTIDTFSRRDQPFCQQILTSEHQGDEEHHETENSH